MTLPKPKSLHQSETFCVSLTCAFRSDYPIVQRAKQIPWVLFENRFGELYCPDNGRLGLSSQMMVGLGLSHARGFSDDEVVEWRLDSPPAQYFYEERHFQLELQPESSSQSRFRSHIGKSGYKSILQLIVITRSGTVALKRSGLKSVPVDTTLQENAVTYPTDAMLSYTGYDMCIILKKIRVFCSDLWRRVDYLLRVGKSNVVSRIPELPFLCLKIP